MIKFNSNKVNSSLAASNLVSGNLVAFPTETVYGLGANATNEKAVSRIYSVKGRPSSHPLIVHISSLEKIENWAINIPEYAIKLAMDFWPGPMTLILPRNKMAKDFITGGQDSVGLRVPAHRVALNLLRKFEDLGGFGVAAPSANRFGAVSPTSAMAVDQEIGAFLSDEDILIDGGPCLIGIESTIIDCTGNLPTVLRPGAITKGMIESTTETKLNVFDKSHLIRASGLLKSHYSPKAKVMLNQFAGTGDGFIALASVDTPPGAIRLGKIETTEQFAREIYELLRLGDSNGLERISVILPHDGDLAEAIADRMSKAAAR